MIRKRGGQPAKRGSYWDTRSWQIFVVGKDGEVLPGGPDHLYLRLNLVEMILFALAISGMYLLFVPFVGFVAFAIAIFIAIGSFLVQKILCVVIRQICKAETWVCDITRRYFCKQCGNDCDDHITMIVKALFFSFFFLAGAVAMKYLGH
ncbi:MAG: hypothetical protein AAB910_02145 [Patescibacteria group bacterium]